VPPNGPHIFEIPYSAYLSRVKPWQVTKLIIRQHNPGTALRGVRGLLEKVLLII
jgi:hypothetical protein